MIGFVVPMEKPLSCNDCPLMHCDGYHMVCPFIGANEGKEYLWNNYMPDEYNENDMDLFFNENTSVIDVCAVQEILHPYCPLFEIKIPIDETGKIIYKEESK